MLNYIWAGLMVLSVVFGICNGRMSEVSAAIMNGGGKAVELTLGLLGAMCFWGGIMNVADKAGVTARISRLISPITKRIFKGMDPKSAPAKAISMNITANLLGLGNAATPLGLKAMREMQKENKTPERATKHMIFFVVLNTASIQLIPTTVAVLRGNYGAASPMDILPAVWITSIVSLTAGLVTAWLLGRFERKK